MTSDEEMQALEARMLAEIPGLAAELERYRPVVRKLTGVSLVAIGIAYREESRRRTSRPRRPVTVANR